MRTEITYIAVDGKKFASEEACLAYEDELLLMNPFHIVFYTDDGKIILKPNEYDLLDSNRFIAYTQDGLNQYNTYCVAHDLAAPFTEFSGGFPRHYQFSRGEWYCIEQKIQELQAEIITNYTIMPAEENSEPRHNLVDGK